MRDLQTFCNTFDFIKLPFVVETVVLSIFEWPLKTGFSVDDSILHIYHKALNKSI